MNSNKEDFLNTFHTQLQTFLLPHKLETSYQIVNCLKDTDDKAVFQLKNSKGQLFVLKRGLRGHIPLLEQEYYILSQLESTNESLFPRCTDFWMEDDVCYLLRTYIQGSSLADYLDNKSSLSQNELLTITFDICQIIQTLHSQQPPIIHRDIIPVYLKEPLILFLMLPAQRKSKALTTSRPLLTTSLLLTTPLMGTTDMRHQQKKDIQRIDKLYLSSEYPFYYRFSQPIFINPMFVYCHLKLQSNSI